MWLLPGVIVGVLGASNVLGWWLRIPALLQVVPGSAAMPFSTGLGFAMTGAGLLIPARNRARRTVQTLLGALVTIYAVGFLVQELFQVEPGMELFLPRSGLDGSPPAHMPPVIAIAFLASGLALALTGRARGHAFAAPALGLVAFLVGLVGFAGYLLRLDFLFSLHPYESVTPQGTAGFVTLAIGLWLNWFRVSRTGPAWNIREDMRILLIGGVILGSMALIAGGATFALLERQTEQTLKRTLELTLENRESVFGSAVRDSLRDTLAISTRPGIRRELRRLQAAPNNQGAREFLNEAIRGFQNLSFEAVTLYDRNGRPVVVAGNFERDPKIQLPIATPYKTEILWTDGVLMRTEARIVENRTPLGTVVTEQRLPLLTNLLNDTRSLGATGEIAVCGREDHTLHCLPMRLHPEPLTQSDRNKGQLLAAGHALNGERGILNGMDYRGKQVIAAYMPIGATGLGMVVKIDSRELYQPIIGKLWLGLLLLAGVAAGGLLLLRWQMHPLVRRLVESQIVLRAANSELRDSETRLRTIIDSTADMVYIRDLEGRYLMMNSVGVRFLGRSVNDIIGRDDTELYEPETARKIREDDRRVIESGRAMTFEYVLTLGDVTRFYLSNKAPYRNAEGNIIGVVGIARDITERKQAEELIRSQSLTDDLTGLYNRRGFLTLAQPALDLTRRTGRKAFLFFADMDEMKEINDTFGHRQGDQALRDAAEILRRTFRGSDIVARLGGDEFAILTQDTRVGHPEDILARLRGNIDAHNASAARDYRLAISVGAVHVDPAAHDTIEELLTQADRAMYDRKHHRRQA